MCWWHLCFFMLSLLLAFPACAWCMHAWPYGTFHLPSSQEPIIHTHFIIPIHHIPMKTSHHFPITFISIFLLLILYVPPLLILYPSCLMHHLSLTISCIPISHWPFPSHHLSLTSSFHITHPMHAPIAIKPIVSYPFSFPSPFLSLARSISLIPCMHP